jgi:hypothetical protein
MTIASINDLPPSLHQKQWSAIVDQLELALADGDVTSTGDLAHRILEAIEELVDEEAFADCSSQSHAKPRVRVPARTD